MIRQFHDHSYLNEGPLWAWPLSKIFPVMAFSGPICYEKQVLNDNI